MDRQICRQTYFGMISFYIQDAEESRFCLKPITSSMTYRHCYLGDRQIDRQTDRQTGKQTDRQAGRQADRETDR